MPLTISLHRSNEVSIQEQVYVREIGGGSSVHHHLIQYLQICGREEKKKKRKKNKKNKKQNTIHTSNDFQFATTPMSADMMSPTRTTLLDLCQYKYLSEAINLIRAVRATFR